MNLVKSQSPGRARSPASLPEWLVHLEQLHPKTMELGLERVTAVMKRLGLAPRFPIITVGGTNGKGSTCAMLEAMLGAAGYRVGCYTSPHLLRYNERVRVAGIEASDAALCGALAAVELARRDTSLTYFEFGTLAALWQFQQEGVDAAILEVGLGGRLDAVNAFDPDCAIVTAVDLDHMDFLGSDRETIGWEKAGIFRTGRPAVCADRNPPTSLLRHAESIGARLRVLGREFTAERREDGWRFRGPAGWHLTLPLPALRGAYQVDNAAAAVAALEALGDRLPVTPEDIRRGLLEATIPGRFQVVAGRPALVLDVAHNPQAARALAANLRRMPCTGKTLAVFAMLADKDIEGVIAAMEDTIDHWLVATIDHPRGAGSALLESRLAGLGKPARESFPDVSSAYRRACQIARENDRIAAFGSFYTVAEVMQQEPRLNGKPVVPHR